MIAFDSDDDNKRLDGLEAAMMLKCSFKTLHRLVKIRKIEPVGTHKNLRNMEFRLGDLKRFMAERHAEPQAAPQQQQPEATAQPAQIELSTQPEPLPEQPVETAPEPTPEPPQTPVEAQSEDTMKNPTKPDDNRLYTPTEARKLCGMAPGTFYGYIKRGKLKPMLVSGESRFREIDLMNFMELVANNRAARAAEGKSVQKTKTQSQAAPQHKPKPTMKPSAKPAAKPSHMMVVIGDVIKLTEAEARAIRLVFPDMNGELKVKKSNILNFETLAALEENKGAFAKIVSGIRSGATVILTANE